MARGRVWPDLGGGVVIIRCGFAEAEAGVEGQGFFHGWRSMENDGAIAELAGVGEEPPKSGFPEPRPLAKSGPNMSRFEFCDVIRNGRKAPQPA